MTTVARVNATLDEDLLARVDEYAARNREDRSTAIRQLLDLALRELAKREAIEAHRGGRLTMRELARALGLDVWGAHDLLAAEGVAIAQGTMAETASDLAAVLAEMRPNRRGRRR
ncbi:MAG: ribbon-helix-helix protein, CopG family [Acidimicrobiales bacterium]